MTRFMQRISWGILPSALVALMLTPSPALCENAADANAAVTTHDPMRPILAPNKLAKNGAKTLAVQYERSDDYKPKFILQGLDGEKVLWSKSIPDPDYGASPQNIDAEAIGTSQIKITKYVRYTPIFSLCLWNGTDFKLISQRVDDTEKKNLHALFDTVASGKLQSQAYYNNVGENFSMVWDWTGRKEIAKMIKRADATAMKDYHAGRLDKALARESASLTAASDLLERILGGTEHIRIEDTNGDQGDGARPPRWLTVFQKAHIKPNVWQDDRTYFPPSDYIGAVNNYAFFLQLQGEHEKAIPIFKKIIAIDPERSVTYLNLGDSLFATGSKGAAETAYKNYELHLDKHTIIPERVIERLKGNL
ncbi:MAG: tetratricopeptide repeat protein [Candidatus Obscuribacterales bacterium]|nr:tetratricopeptide repeat protein [Candidatus Obscuribacterales bacterium]